jgi:ATP-dependent DNA ligase
MALQRRLTAARRAAAEAPVTFVFDVLAADGTDLRTHPYRVRRALLLQLLDDAAPPLAVIPMTTDGKAARAWLTGHLDAGIEGVVAKRLDRRWRGNARLVDVEQRGTRPEDVTLLVAWRRARAAGELWEGPDPF